MGYFRLLAALAGSAFLFSGTASAQNFTIRIFQDGSSTQIGNGSSLGFGADAVNKPVSTTMTISYRGVTQGALGKPELVGSSEFYVRGLPVDFPVLLEPGANFTFTIAYGAGTANRTTGQMTIPVAEASADPRGSPTLGSLGFNLIGTAPDFVYYYALQTDSNSIPISPGGKILFPPTAVNGSTLAILSIANRGSGVGSIESISGAGAAFQVLGVPSLPASVEPARDVRVTVRYSPKVIETSSGSVQVSAAGKTASFGVEGSSTGFVLAYELLRDDAASKVLPNDIITLPDTAVGQKLQTIVRVRNTGNGDLQLQGIGVLGIGFQIPDLPFFPYALPAGGALLFTLDFIPQQTGRATARLRIGNDTFDVVSNGLGPKLAYSYSSGGSPLTVSSPGAVIFTPLQVGQTATAEFSVENQGTRSSTINSVDIVAVTSQPLAFKLSDVPALPLALEPGGKISFKITYAPTLTGAIAASLRVDTAVFALSSSATPPPDLPAYELKGPAAGVDAMQQPGVTLKLASPYPLTLVGALVLTVNSEGFTVDPAVQFTGGGRQIGFSIAAGATEARFCTLAGSGSQGQLPTCSVNDPTEVKLQTGTVAGTIKVTPSFVSQGGLNLTPESPASLTLTIPQVAPRLLNVQVGGRTANALLLVVNGYATTRSLSQLDLQFTPSGSYNVAGASVTINIDPAAVLWFGSATSQNFGGLFSAAIPFTLQSDEKLDPRNPPTKSPIDALQSVTVKASNSKGQSNSVSVDLK